jgi:hypothetical protein
VSQNHFPRGSTGEKVSCLLLTRDRIYLADRFENQWIDLVMPDF